ncbi:Phenylacetic acid catabolic protein [Paracoccus sp. (in: a-proteobacteria)]|uniref:Phenylacetic acid catabolic protein n=1 Tax=Paracoccus sp. TaxID=267 RepID=UPI0028A03560|nr:Phenylacetic acid catabolic protein [Paracoccus sp. (in: a-proteobacteria)]
MSDTVHAETMNIEDYLAQGGVLTSPDNVPARYRGELMRMMSSFVDSELAGSAGFADSINFAPGIKERIAASRITLEKADHAERVLNIMGDFGTDTARYQATHDWSARLPRDAQHSGERMGADMRLSVFHYPLESWIDAVVMNVLMGLVSGVQLAELAKVSYAPLAETFRDIAPREARHAELGLEGLERVIATPAGRDAALAAIAYWRPRVAATFGSPTSSRYHTQARFGLRHTPNGVMQAEWEQLLADKLGALDLN